MMSGRQSRLTLRIIASTLLASLFAVLALAANPHWHAMAHAEHAHGDQHHEHDRSEHSCVVDLFASGAVDHVSPVAFTADLPVFVCPSNTRATTEHVSSVFLSGSVLEHAPPAQA